MYLIILSHKLLHSEDIAYIVSLFVDIFGPLQTSGETNSSRCFQSNLDTSKVHATGYG